MRTLYNGDRRELSLRGQITFKDGKSTWVEIGDIFSYSINSQIGSDGLPLGGTESASFSLELDNTGRKYTPESFDSAEVHMLLGIRPDPRNYIRNSEFRFDRRDWDDWGSPAMREFVTEGDQHWCHIKGTGTARFQGVQQAAAALPTDGEVCFSALAKGGTAGQQFTVTLVWRDPNDTLGQTSQNFTVGTEPQRVYFTARPSVGSTQFTIMAGVDDETTAYDVYFTELMLESGTELHDWQPAPEDFDAQVAEDGYAWSDFGVWYVDNASAPEQSVSIQLSGYDALATHFTAKFEDAPTLYPLPLKDLFLTVATAAHVTPGETDFSNANYGIAEMPAWDENVTLRDALSYIAIAAGGFARVSRDGKLEIVSFSRGATHAIGPDSYNTFTLTGGSRYAFNAIEALMDSETEEYTRFAIDDAVPANATNTIQLDYNPLLNASLVSSIVDDLDGISMDAGSLTSGGDPWINCGDYYSVTTLNGEVYRIMVTSQAFTFDGGLGCTDSCNLPSENSVSSASYSTSANAYDRNGNLRASRVAGLDGHVLAATEAHFQHLTAESAEFDTLLASFIEALNLVVGRIDANAIDTDSLTAIVADISKAVIGEAKIDVAQIENLTATILDAVTASIGTADIDYAHLKDLLADKAIITDGVGESLLIERLFVTSANLLGATIGKLVLQGEDGRYYEVVVSSDGEISTREVTVSEGEILAGETEDGRQIVATDANIRDLNAQNIRAQSAIITEIFTSALTAGKITASEAMIASATIPTLYATTIKAIGDQLDLSANESVRIFVNQEMAPYEERVNEVEKQTTANSTAIEATQQQIELRATKEEVTEAVNGTLGSVRVEYCQSISNTVAPSGPWSTTAPPWEDGKYMWQRTTTVKMDGSTHSSEATCITGATGQTGADGAPGKDGSPGAPGANGTNGVSVTQITPQYYLSTSQYTQTGGSTTTTPPAWQSGRYLWTRSMINYSDGNTGYSSWVLDNTWNDLGRRVSEAEATLTVQAGEIAAKVSQDDLQSAIIQNASSIRLNASEISWESKGSSLTQSGVFTSRSDWNDSNWLRIENGEIFGGQGSVQYGEIDVSSTVDGKKGITLSGEQVYISSDVLSGDGNIDFNGDIECYGDFINGGNRGASDNFYDGSGRLVQVLGGIIVSVGSGGGGGGSGFGFTTVELNNTGSSARAVSASFSPISGANSYFCTGVLGWSTSGRPGINSVPSISGTTLTATLAGNSTVLFGILGVP